jgi:hypothetical protein
VEEEDKQESKVEEDSCIQENAVCVFSKISWSIMRKTVAVPEKQNLCCPDDRGSKLL